MLFSSLPKIPISLYELTWFRIPSWIIERVIQFSSPLKMTWLKIEALENLHVYVLNSLNRHLELAQEGELVSTSARAEMLV